MGKKKVILTDKAPKPVLPVHSQGIMVTNGKALLFCTGQTSRDPRSGQVLYKGDVEAQARRAIENLKAIVEAAGGTLDNVVKVGIYYKNVEDVAKVAKVRAEYFKKDPPCSTGIGVQLVDKDLLVEIDAIAVL